MQQLDCFNVAALTSHFMDRYFNSYFPVQTIDQEQVWKMEQGDIALVAATDGCHSLC
jgi:uncharacterized protein YhbP (UPF0306 family)